MAYNISNRAVCSSVEVVSKVFYSSMVRCGISVEKAMTINNEAIKGICEMADVNSLLTNRHI